MDSDDEERKVKELLQQCGDEAALKLVTTESCLEAGLLARFQRLKEGGKDAHVPSSLQSSVMSPSQMASSSPKMTSAASDEEGKVKELLQQCGDEAALKLVTNESCLEAGLLARFQHLKEGGKDPHVLSRPAALQSSVMSPSQMASSSPKMTSAASEAKKLLESMSDQVRLEKLTLSTHSSSSDKTFHSSEEESFDFEVDKIVEWAKDAAPLSSQQEEEENPVFVRDMSPAPGEIDSKKKKKASWWKFW